MLKRTPEKKKSLGFTSSSPTTGRDFNPGRFLSGLTKAHYPKGFGPSVNAVYKTGKLVEWLRKKHGNDDAAADLAFRLRKCKPKSRCWSGACPCCTFAAQAFTTEVALKFLTSHPDRTKIVCVSVVPADGQIPAGQLNPDQHARNTRRWKEALGRAGVTWFLGASDWSFNEHKNGRYHESWLEHFYGFTVTDDPKKLRRSLKEQFQPNDAIPRPVQVKSWDGDKTAIDYMLKPVFKRRIGTDDGQRHEKETGGERECRATDKQPLRAEQKHELLMFLDQIGIQSRFLMRWLQFVHLAGTGWTVADRAPKGRMHGNGQSG
jgi:hypothetical protein